MHPSLHLSNLDKLFIPSRRIAIAACAPHPPAADIDRFAHALKTSSQSVAFLPVHYIILDPGRIPAAERLDSCDADTICTVSAALEAISTLVAVKGVSPEVGEDLWPRVWMWSNFLWTFRDALSGVIALSEGLLCVHLITFSDRVCTYAPNKVMVLSTPGFQALVVRAWVFLLRTISLAIGTSVAEDRIAGAGGTAHDLGRLVINHFKLVTPNGDVPPTMDQLWLLQLVLDIILFTDGLESGVATDGSDFGSTYPLCLTLASTAFVRTLTMIARTNSHAVTTNDRGIVNKCFGILIVLFKISPGQRLLRVAVQHGLLLAIVTSAMRPGPDSLQNTILLLLTQVLAPAGIHYSVIAELSSGCLATAEIVASHPFHRQEVFDAWAKFEQGVQFRSMVLRAFNSKERVSLRACDNTDASSSIAFSASPPLIPQQCGIILEKASLRRCSACFHLLYCSVPCQRQDWRSGHRESCVFHRKYRAAIRLAYTPREYAFLRAILHHDYEVARSVALYNVYAEEWAARPDSVLYTAFDYQLIEVNVSVQHAQIDPADSNSAFWADMLAQATRSAGRMELHTMMTSDLPDALKQIAVNMRSLDSTRTQQQLRNLVSRGVAGEIH
ncbi:hypothetical protein DFH06DRAFT_1407427 [Mycena polygramma]|nr:hypothetical protein DFH06DRAFT_1407427 [Mycena polygramma]